MKRTGPPPKPTAIRKADGNPSRRPFNDAEPMPRAARPTCPAHLDPAAKREWRKIVPMLDRMRVYTEADEQAAVNLAFDCARLKEAQKQLTETGFLVLNKVSGAVKINPLVHIVNRLTINVSNAFREFGMTPASRTRIRTESASTDQEDIKAAIEALKRPRTDTARVQ